MWLPDRKVAADETQSPWLCSKNILTHKCPECIGKFSPEQGEGENRSARSPTKTGRSSEHSSRILDTACCWQIKALRLLKLICISHALLDAPKIAHLLCVASLKTFHFQLALTEIALFSRLLLFSQPESKAALTAMVTGNHITLAAISAVQFRVLCSQSKEARCSSSHCFPFTLSHCEFQEALITSSGCSHQEFTLRFLPFCFD